MVMAALWFLVVSILAVLELCLGRLIIHVAVEDVELMDRTPALLARACGTNLPYRLLGAEGKTKTPKMHAGQKSIDEAHAEHLRPSELPVPLHMQSTHA